MKAVPNAKGKDTTDCYQTPHWALDFLFHYWQPQGVIWEPAEGLGSITTYCKTNKRKCVGTSLEHGQDFLTYKPTFKFGAIVTNPPFSIKNKFILRCLEHCKPFALLMPITAIEGRERQTMWRQCKLTILVPKIRVEYKRFDGKLAADGRQEARPNMLSCWFIGELGTGCSLVFDDRK